MIFYNLTRCVHAPYVAGFPLFQFNVFPNACISACHNAIHSKRIRPMVAFLIVNVCRRVITSAAAWQGTCSSHIADMLPWPRVPRGALPRKATRN